MKNLSSLFDLIILSIIFGYFPPRLSAYYKPKPSECSNSAYAAECKKICDYANKKILYINSGGMAAVPGEMDSLKFDIANYCEIKAVQTTDKPTITSTPIPTETANPTITPTGIQQKEAAIKPQTSLWEMIIQWFKKLAVENWPG